MVKVAASGADGYKVITKLLLTKDYLVIKKEDIWL